MARFHGLLVCLALVGLGGTVAACDNDSETSTHEREFRSQYGGLAGLPTIQEFANDYPIHLNLLIGGGVVLLTASLALVAKRVRVRA